MPILASELRPPFEEVLVGTVVTPADGDAVDVEGEISEGKAFWHLQLGPKGLQPTPAEHCSVNGPLTAVAIARL